MEDPKMILQEYFLICLSAIPDGYAKDSLLRVDRTSPWTLRREVQKFAVYFKREFRFSDLQFEADETDALIRVLCGHTTAVSNSQGGQSQTFGHDMELYTTIVWDLADAFSKGWYSVDLENFPLNLARNNTHCIVLPTLPISLREAIDRQLRGTVGYLGAVELDLGNPVQAVLFIDYLVDDAFIEGGAVCMECGFDGVGDTVFNGATDFMPGGLKQLMRGDFEERRPALPIQEVSERGRESLARYRGKKIVTIEERVMNSLAELRDPGGTAFSFASTSTGDGVLEAELPEAKFVHYLLNPNHPDGSGKAKFFHEVLAIGPGDWRYLAAQFYEGLRNTSLSDVKIKTWDEGFGASFNCVLPITGLNGRAAFVFTNWILRPGELPRLSTARPHEKSDQTTIVSKDHQSVGSATLSGTKRWEELYRLAHTAGMAAAEECVPTPMKLEGLPVVMDGMCGSAWIRIPEARKGFARWVVRSKVGYLWHQGGAAIFSAHSTQSIDRCVAYTKAFARVLKLNGVECTVDCRLD